MRVYIVYDCINNNIPIVSKVFNDLFGAQQHASSLIGFNCDNLDCNELVWYDKYLGKVYVYIECKELGRPYEDLTSSR